LAKPFAFVTAFLCTKGMTAQLKFSKEFLPLMKKSQRSLLFEFAPTHQNVKHEIELLGIPHTSIGHLWLNDEEVDFYYRPEPGDIIEVEGPTLPIDVTTPTWLQPVAYPAYRFLVDICVGALTPKLRMMGCDVLADPSLHDRDLAIVSYEEQRVLLTRDRRLLMRKEVEWGHFVAATNPHQQLQEVIHRFAIPWLPEAFLRCMSCNGWIVPVAKKDILDQLEPKTRLHYNDFSQCENCKKIYWEGSHYHRMRSGVPTGP
jgi:uncharacterized protein with PIN domain